MSASLSDFLNRPELIDKILNEQQTRGFVTAMAAAPYIIDPSEWIAFLWGENDVAPFEHQADLEQYLNLIIALWNETRAALFHNDWQWPTACQLDDKDIINAEAKDFTEGLLQGWQITRDDWESLMPEDSQDNALLGGVLLSISLLYDPENALNVLSEYGADSLAQFEEIYQAMPNMLCGLAQRGQALQVQA